MNKFKLVTTNMILGASIAAFASLAGNGGVESYLNDDTEVIHTFNESGNFVLYSDAAVRMLVVAGGGGGGYDCSGGGGGGGVIETNLTLSAGTYSIVVGEGGAFGGTGGQKGKNGGDSVFTFVKEGAQAELLRAFGGGGGGAYASGSGANGGSGGGGANGGNPGQGVEGQGYPSVKGWSPQAGGGAGGSPILVDQGKGNWTTRMASGGPGRASDITGVVDYYGPGGGAGGYDGLAGLGGDTIPDADGFIWGCGYSNGGASSIKAQMAANFQHAEGRPNHGGGGGGGNNNFYYGANGGSGVVILRMENKSTAIEPAIAISDIKTSNFAAKTTITVDFAGANSQSGTVALYQQLSDKAEDFNEDGSFEGTETELDPTFIGVGSYDIKDLRCEKTYFVRYVAINDAGDKAITPVTEFTTPKQTEVQWVDKYGRNVTDGLLQKFYSSNLGNVAFDESDETLIEMPGAIATGISLYVNDKGIYNNAYIDKDGVMWSQISGKAYAYLGYMWLEAGSTYNFFGNYMDNYKLEIDGEHVFNGSYTQLQTGLYECVETGWHRIQMWFVNYSGNSGNSTGWTYAFGWNKDGATIVNNAPGVDEWSFMHIDHGAVLKTGKPGRTVNVDSYSISDAGLSFNVNIDSGDDGVMYVCYGDTYGGDEQAEWENVSFVQSVLGDSTELDASIPESKYVRFVIVHEDGAISWSKTTQVDLSNVILENKGVSHDGDVGTFFVNVGSKGTGDFSLKLLVSKSSDMSDAVETPIEASTQGEYSVTTPLEGGTTYYYTFVGETSEGGYDSTLVASFTTLSGTVLPESPSLSVNNRTVTVRLGKISYGAGKTTLKVFVGQTPDVLEEREFTIGEDNFGEFINVVFPELPCTWYIKVVAESVAPGGSSWTTETSVISATTVDAVTYTWKIDVAEGMWDDPNNWNVTGMPSDGLYTGFPSNNNASVTVAINTDATIKLPEASYHLKNFYFASRDVNIKYVGEGATVSKLYADYYGGNINNENIEISNMTFSERKDIIDDGYGQASSTNLTLKLSNGAETSFNGHQRFGGTNTQFFVESGAIFKSSGIIFSTANGCIFVNDGTIKLSQIVNEVASHVENQKIVLAGKGALVIISDVLYLDASDKPQTQDLNLIFSVPAGGYTNDAPFASTSTNAKVLGSYMNADSTCKLVVSVDPRSPQLRGGATAVDNQLILWRKGIATDNIVIEPTKGVAFYYTYGWPSVELEPTIEDELPTGLRCYIPPTAGTMIFVR